MTRIVFATLLATGLAAGAAQAQAPDIATTTMPFGGVVAGGAIATLSGSGDDMLIIYATPGAGGGGLSEQPGRALLFTGSDGEGRPSLTATGPTTLRGDGREAKLTGSGEDAQITYVDVMSATRR